MIVTKMTVDGNEFFLDAEQDVDGAKEQVVEAAQHGAGLVDVTIAGHVSVSVLVSQQTPVTFEQIVAEEEGADHAFGDDFWSWAELAL
ncbi:hypothetical protein [Lacisediminihabitans changchengi]|uniref:Uncharacterized protein n=1 Tax=Lacisediminihabitans changchengi TaxID=2787634 RepID=A0A934VYP9_9MICO|nr:hypothetical protein [Lacisediminihabitans changchengi]MBK4348272.1 hypothetical protein [Lacisediminihabitans changchengi]